MKPSDPYGTMLAALRDGSLDPEGFSHRHHIGVAAAALQKYPFFEALWLFADGLQKLTIRAGVPDKFNATITMASMSLVAERLAREPDLTVERFIDRYPELMTADLVRTLYSPERLQSAVARRTGLLPTSLPVAD